MSDNYSRVYGDLMFLRTAAAFALRVMQDQLPDRAECAEAMNTLYGALYPDTDTDEIQERIYAALAPAGFPGGRIVEVSEVGDNERN